MANTDSVEESAAIKALGPLFKITEVFLWDDGISTVPEASVHIDNLLEEEAMIFCTTANTSSSIINHTDEYTSVEDFELAKQMDALGLPISFSTSKKNNIVAVKPTKRKGIQDKSVATEATTGDTYHNVFEDQYRRALDRESISTAAGILADIVEKQVGAQHELSSCDTGMQMTSEVLELSSGPEDIHGNDCEYLKSLAQEDKLFQKNVLDDYVECPSISGYIAGDTNGDNGHKTMNSCPTTMESSMYGTSADHHVSDYSENLTCYEFGDWRVIWDSFYNRNYFYNIQSLESTWYPPPGLEHFAICSSISNSNDMSNDTAEKHSEIISSRMSGEIIACSDGHGIVKRTAVKHVSLHTSTDHSTDKLDVDEYQEKQKNHMKSETCSVLDMSFEHTGGNSWVYIDNGETRGENGSDLPNIGLTLMDELDVSRKVCGNKKKKKRLQKLQSRLTLQESDGFVPANIVKYWCQRYLLFSRFDDGIKMDEEGWFSVTPESIAKHHASRCSCGIIIDGFTGVGGNAIQFAMKSNYVIAVDIDLRKIDCAQDNAAIYEVSDKINFIQGDFFQIAPRLKGDVIFLSPPWGGPNYRKVQAYDIRTMLKPHDGQHLFEIARTIASKVVMFLPRNVDLNQLAELSLSVNPPWSLEVEKNFLNGKLKAITAYFGSPTL